MSAAPDLEHALQQAVGWAEEAAELTRSRFGGPLKSRRKADRSLVTEVDLLSQQLILERIHGAYPDHDIIAEEQDTCIMRGATSCWVVDPLDGTRNYSRGLGVFAISIALLQNGVPRLGIIADPMSRCCYTALSGQGAGVDGRPLRVSDRPLEAQPILGISARQSTQIPPTLYGEGVRKLVHRNLGSCCLLLALTAAGVVDVCYGLHAKIWDLAAGSVLLEEAGGRLTCARGHALFPRDPGSDVQENLDFMGGSPSLHAVLVQRLNESGRKT